MLAMMFPGQGSQSVGMLSSFADGEPVVTETFGEASRVLGYDLWQLCQQGPEDRLAETERTQPAMLAAGVAVWRAWRRRGGRLPEIMAGHSLGEYSALVCAGAIDYSAAIELVRAGETLRVDAYFADCTDSARVQSMRSVLALLGAASWSAPIAEGRGRSARTGE